MKNLKKGKLLFILATSLTINLFGQDSPKKVDLTINKNFELFYAMYLSTNVDSMLIANKYVGFPLITQKDFSLKNRYYKEFSGYKDSPQVRFYNEIASQGFVFGAPFNALLRVDTSLNIIDSCYFKQLPLPPAAKESVVIFINKLKEFSDLSKFDDFYQQNKPLYDTIIKINKEKVTLDKLVLSIEDFFGWRLKGYHVILSPLMWPGGISLDYKENCRDSLPEIYIGIGPKSVENDIPYFGSDEEYESVITHEFVHPFITYYCLKYIEQIDRYAALYKKDENVYLNNGCQNWFSAINELLTRTVEIIITSHGDSEKAAKAVEYQSKNLGFSYIPILYKAFEEYYCSKTTKKINLDMTFLDIIHSLDEFEK